LPPLPLASAALADGNAAGLLLGADL